MTSEERDRRLSVIEMDSVDLRIAYRALGDSLGAFVGRVHLYRPDASEAFFERWRAQRDRADAEAARLEEAIFEANAGITNDGPDRWSAELDAYNYERTKGR